MQGQNEFGQKSSKRQWKPLRRVVVWTVGLGLVVVACGPEKPPEFDELFRHRDIVVAASPAGRLITVWDEAETRSATCEPIGPAVYCSTTAPRFVALEQAAENAFPLDPRVTVIVEIVALTPGARLRLEQTVADAPGARVLLGSGDEIHVHAAWEYLSAERLGEMQISFRLLANLPLYEPSPTYTAPFYWSVLKVDAADGAHRILSGAGQALGLCALIGRPHRRSCG